MEAELPDGRVLEFPDGTDPAVIQRTVKQMLAPDQSHKGTLWPVSTDREGKPYFDSDAGLLGALKRTFMLPGDVFTGKVDPNSPEGRDRAMEFGLTVAGSPTAAPISELGVLGALPKTVKPKVPTAEALRAAADRGYKQAGDMGVEYAGKSVKELAANVQRSLEKEGILAELSPKTFAILNKLQAGPDDSVVLLSSLDAARKGLGRVTGDETDKLAAKRAIQAIDEFFGGPDPAAVVAGPAADAGRILETARGNYGAAKRSERLTNAEDSAQLRADVSNSGTNVDNAIRQRLRPIVDPTQPKNARGYSPEELAAIGKVARGTPVTNTTRFMGNLLGGGGGLGATVTGLGTMGATGDPFLGAAVPLAGVGLRRLAQALTERGVSQADELIRSRSPLYEGMPATQTPGYQLSPQAMRALAAALAAQNQQ